MSLLSSYRRGCGGTEGGAAGAAGATGVGTGTGADAGAAGAGLGAAAAAAALGATGILGACVGDCFLSGEHKLHQGWALGVV